MLRPEETLTPKQVARAIGVSESSIKRWCDTGLIKTVRTSGGHRRLPVNSVLDYLKEKGHPLVAPELLGLPSNTSDSERILNRSREIFLENLLAGDESLARQVIIDLLDAHHGLSKVLDQVVFSSLKQIKTRVAHDESQMHLKFRANQICLRVFYEIRPLLSAVAVKAPIALTAALDDSTDTLNVTAAELVLLNGGWQATSLGNRLSFETINEAVEKHHPQLLYLHLKEIFNETEFVKQLEKLKECTTKHGTSLLIGSANLSPKSLPVFHLKQFCQNYAELESKSQSLI